jgi:hypothetical protein
MKNIFDRGAAVWSAPSIGALAFCFLPRPVAEKRKWESGDARRTPEMR